MYVSAERVYRHAPKTMRKGNLSLYLPPPSALAFAVEAFTEKGKAKSIISLFERMHAQVGAVRVRVKGQWF